LFANCIAAGARNYTTLTSSEAGSYADFVCRPNYSIREAYATDSIDAPQHPSA